MKKRFPSKRGAEKSALGFIANGIACNCLVLLETMGILDFLAQGHSVDISMLHRPDFCSHPVAAESAFLTLEKTGVLEETFGKYSLTELGDSLVEYIGLITMLFEGYGSLMAAQGEIGAHPEKKCGHLMNGKSIAEASILFGKKSVDPLVSHLVKQLQVKGTLCDLGCGVGTRLRWLCEETGNPGLGFENDPGAIALARKTYGEDGQVSIESEDITRLQGVWEDVTVLMQYFVFHDFACTPLWLSTMNAYLDHFPNLSYFIYVDVVAPSETKNELMPGYDYVHGLLGIETPTYEEMRELFDQSKFAVMQERAVPHLPNTFLWVLTPQRH